jgi:hypothetical protein
MRPRKLIPGGVLVALWGMSILGFVLSIWSPGAANMGAGAGMVAIIFTIMWVVG